jgi:hypothetical protein
VVALAPGTASVPSLSVEFWLNGPAVRSPSAVAPATVSNRQRRQPLDLRIVPAANAVNGHKRPVTRSHRVGQRVLVRCGIEK